MREENDVTSGQPFVVATSRRCDGVDASRTRAEASSLPHGRPLRRRLEVELPPALLIEHATASGAAATSFFFKVEDARLHGTQVLLLAVFIGLVIFMIFALDRPFRGDLGLRPDPYQLIYDQLMKNHP